MWWRVYYDSGEFSSEDGGPFDAPRTGVLAVAREDPWVGYRIISGEDYYYYEPDRDGWQCTDIIGMADHLQRAKAPLVLFGRTVTAGQYKNLLTRIREHYGDKQGWLPEEKRRHV